MNCRIVEMRNREVICLKDGSKLGNVCDVEINTCTGMIRSIVVYGRPKWFGIMGREEDIVIPWEQISVFGDDTVLVDYEPVSRAKRKYSENP